MKEQQEKTEKNNKFKSIMKKILSIFGAGAMIALPSIAVANKDKTQKEDPKNLETTSFRETLRSDTPTVEGELNKIVNGTKVEATYEEIMVKFEEIMKEKKSYSDVEYDYLKTFINNVYQNYDSWKSVIPSLPSKSEYIENVILPSIKKSQITMYEWNDDQTAQIFENMKYAIAETLNNKITFIYDEAYKSDETVKNRESEVLGHEVAGHVHQDNIINKSEDTFVCCEWLKIILTEGMATATMRFAEPYDAIEEYLPATETEGYVVMHKKILENDYYEYMSIAYMLTNMLSYQTMEDMNSLKIKPTDMEEIIAEKYGEEFKEKFIEAMQGLVEFKEYRQIQEDDKMIMKYEIKLHNLYLESLEQSINKAKTIKDLELIKKQIELYENVLKIEVLDSNNEYKDITQELIHFHLDKKIKEKEKMFCNLEK